MSAHYKTILKIHSKNGKSMLDAVASPEQPFDFSKITPLPLGHEHIHDLQNDEAIYYFLTNRLTQKLATFEYKMYFVGCRIPDLRTPSLENLISMTQNYISKFDENGLFNRNQHAGFYPFPHNRLDDLYATGKSLVYMIDKYNINDLSYWKLQHWGSYTNALRCDRIDDAIISFECLNKGNLKVVNKFIQTNRLDCSLQFIDRISNTIADHKFSNGLILT